MESLSNNPVYNALLSGHAHFNKGNDEDKFFDELVSPFAGVVDELKNGFEALHELLTQGR